jgi:hypothetical protein
MAGHSKGSQGLKLDVVPHKKKKIAYFGQMQSAFM